MFAIYKPFLNLSIIIVNYNVRHFLEQCLYAVRQACKGIAAEVIVVDNHSNDGSVEYLQPQFPDVKFIASTTNLGFAKACNMGWALASGNYTLFLNPDTIVAEDCFTTCISFFQNHANCGAVGVKMIDGSGVFLKESKRSFPAPLTALYKLLGLSAMFPKSQVFSRYHLGNLDNDKSHEVDVLSGAFMMIKKEVLQKTGGFDESFFMYGEDVDLSYRIQKAGYKNYYVANTTIVHFKGESTKKGSLNYVRLFYKAMSVFVRKHYGGTRAGLFTGAIQLAILLRAAVSAAGKLIRWVGLPVIDAILILFSFWLAKEVWVAVVKTTYQYPQKLLLVSLPAFTLLYWTVAYYAGLYHRYYKAQNLVRAAVTASLVLLAAYALLPEQYRFSRGIVVLGALFALLLIGICRQLLLRLGIIRQLQSSQVPPYIMVVGNKSEYRQIVELLKDPGLRKKIIGHINLSSLQTNNVTSPADFSTAIRTLKAREFIFCAGSLSYRNIITQMQQLSGHIKMRIHATGSSSIVGSDASTQSGEVWMAGAPYNVAQPGNRRLKRLIDVLASLFLICSFPIHVFTIKNPRQLFINCIHVLTRKKTWVGYLVVSGRLPQLKAAVVGANGLPVSGNKLLADENLHKIDDWYARYYQPLQDLKIIINSYRYLDS